MPASVVPSTPTSSPRNSVNVRRVLDVLRNEGPTSQAKIARRTGLSPATINSIVRRLREQGVADVRQVNGRENVVTLATGSGVFLALEVAHDRVMGTALSFDRGLRVDDERVNESSPEVAMDLAAALANSSGMALAEVSGVAIAIQAPVEASTNAIVAWCNSRLPHWAGVGLTDLVRTEYAGAALSGNDAQFGALAEWTWGAGRGARDFMYLAGASGIGGGLVVDGKIYRGGTGMAGDIGHVALEETGDVCYCGNRGCLTTLVSERAILDAVRLSRGDKQTLEDVIAAARAGDAASQRVLSEAGRHIGRALANSAKVFAPSVIAVGGQLGRAGNLVFDGLLSSIEVSNMRAGSQSTQFVTGVIGADAARLGAISALLEESDMGVSFLEPWAEAKAS